MDTEKTYRPLTWPLFLELIRLPAKAASLLPFLLGVAYAKLAFGQLDWVNTSLYFVGQMSIALFVTGFNNVQDYYKAKDLQYRATQNIIGREHLSPRRMLALMGAFLALAVVMGLALVWRTNLSLLLIGGAGIFVAIFYTFGPVPLSRIPCGELLAGLCEGFGTIFIACFVNITPRPVDLTFTASHFALSADLSVILQLLLVALPIVILDGTVMFADNICDIDQDIRNQRFTLPYYLSKEKALRIYPWLPRLAFACVVLAVLLRLLPWPLLAVLLLWPLVRRNTQRFLAKQSKQETFNTAISSLLLVASGEVVLIVVAIWL
ncbi:UbiA family prenyltransferase [Lacticaseibacillus yichunensis]|uniref:UbiA family prenyltransferase n=1 Tax=Lacticaseibacillus yichunensis TaxID=2486015 RepID=A0ABW4CJT6_9LACO|nr:UbiA family prenyltransferase [Lacticaseibacillus yichunensis]